MTFPTREDVTTTVFGTAVASHAVAMPATVNVGDLLLVLFGNDNGDVVASAPTGWVRVGNSPNGPNPGAVCQAAIFMRQSDGTEGGTTVAFVTDQPSSTATKAVAHVYRISGWYGGTISGTENEGYSTNTQVGTSTTPNPPWNHAGGWGVADNLWIAWYVANQHPVLSSYPTDYLDGVYTQSDAGTPSVSMGSAWHNSPADAEDPGAFTLASSEEWVATTIALRPSAGTGETTSVVQRGRAQPMVGGSAASG